MLEPLQYVLGGAAGSLVGFTLGLVGGGGSILAVPLMVYVVGVTSPHLVIGTSALAVAANAAANLVPHARQGAVKWRCAGMYAVSGVAGALAQSSSAAACWAACWGRRHSAGWPRTRGCSTRCLPY